MMRIVKGTETLRLEVSQCQKLQSEVLKKKAIKQILKPFAVHFKETEAPSSK